MSKKLLEIVHKLSEKHLWLEKEFMREYGYIIPSCQIFSYCPNCKRTGIIMQKFNIPVELLRKIFQTLLRKGLSEARICRKCKNSSIILGYSYVSEGWLLETTKEEDEEFSLYYKAIGTLAKHPKRKEVVVQTVSTAFGEIYTIVEEVIRKNGIILFRGHRKAEALTGTFIVKLEQIPKNIDVM
jgi:hemerythrin